MSLAEIACTNVSPELEIPDLATLIDPASRPDPYRILGALRDASPHVASDGLVVVGRYGDCSKVLRDPGMSSEHDRSRLAGGRGARAMKTGNFLHLDPPDHTRIRRLVTKAFTPRAVAALEPRIRAMVDELLTAARDRGSLDVVTGLAHPLPVRVICELLGVPAEDHGRFQEWSASLAETLEPPLPGLVGARAKVAAAQARAEFIAYFRELIAERRASARDDLVSHLIQVKEDGDQLTESELLATCILLINAGHETSANLINNGVLALLRHPDQLDLLRREPALAPSVVEEVLRYDTPVQLTLRVASEPTRLGDARIEADDLIVLLLGAANRDPEAYEDPDRFDIRRTAARPHLSFSAGPHFCLGAGLARLEARIVFEVFASRFVNPRLSAAEIAYKPNLNLRGPARLEIEFDTV
ncbi:cytochrome P450 [Streptomyces sp. NPDC091371]|uniref:cytochrome P450 n=1 Tax=Streptomyces sp. NPDC091371 TaxID=3155303 RepID=UPI003427330E